MDPHNNINIQNNFGRPSNRQNGGGGGFLLLLVIFAIFVGIYTNQRGFIPINDAGIPYMQDRGVDDEPLGEDGQGSDTAPWESYNLVSEEPSEEPGVWLGEPEVYIADNKVLGDYLTYNGTDVIEEGGASDLIVGTEPGIKFGDLDEYQRPTYAHATLSQGTTVSSEGRPGLTYDPVGFINKQYINRRGNSYWLYDRSHLVAYTLWNGDIDTPQNLLTGTQTLNRIHMVRYENLIRDELSEGHLVEYYVEPVYHGEELVARQVVLRIKSGSGLDLKATIFNVQEGVTINYLTGESTDGSGVLQPVNTLPEVTTREESVNTLPVPTSGEVYYRNCGEAKEAGKSPLRKGDEGYREALDKDKDGVACE